MKFVDEVSIRVKAGDGGNGDGAHGEEVGGWELME